eukprot:TRINITY_DN4921_c0_g1_i2.p1 TRINITY_DN4921_c0_g1~~TRINITY_DN4921_c0_g1_i2.p1  ORF type:complete len:657 (+),score=193.41 TRINITY_DN4921_c0_g1_i2:33-1973(+)
MRIDGGRLLRIGGAALACCAIAAACWQAGRTAHRARRRAKAVRGTFANGTRTDAWLDTAPPPAAGASREPAPLAGPPPATPTPPAPPPALMHTAPSPAPAAAPRPPHAGAVAALAALRAAAEAEEAAAHAGEVEAGLAASREVWAMATETLARAVTRANLVLPMRGNGVSARRVEKLRRMRSDADEAVYAERNYTALVRVYEAEAPRIRLQAAAAAAAARALCNSTGLGWPPWGGWRHGGSPAMTAEALSAECRGRTAAHRLRVLRETPPRVGVPRHVVDAAAAVNRNASDWVRKELYRPAPRPQWMRSGRNVTAAVADEQRDAALLSALPPADVAYLVMSSAKTVLERAGAGRGTWYRTAGLVLVFTENGSSSAAAQLCSGGAAAGGSFRLHGGCGWSGGVLEALGCAGGSHESRHTSCKLVAQLLAAALLPASTRWVMLCDDDAWPATAAVRAFAAAAVPPNAVAGWYGGADDFGQGAGLPWCAQARRNSISVYCWPVFRLAGRDAAAALAPPALAGHIEGALYAGGFDDGSLGFAIAQQNLSTVHGLVGAPGTCEVRTLAGNSTGPACVVTHLSRVQGLTFGNGTGFAAAARWTFERAPPAAAGAALATAPQPARGYAATKHAQTLGPACPVSPPTCSMLAPA